jgi:hypothetical protein
MSTSSQAVTTGLEPHSVGDNDWERAEKMLNEWKIRVRHSQHSHHEAGKFYKMLNYALSVPVVVLTAAIGTSAFASLQKQTSDTAKLWLGGLSMLAAVLTALQTHFQFGQRAEKHKALGAQYGNIRREIEEILVLPPQERGDRRKCLDEIRAKKDEIGGEGDVVPRWIWNRTLKMLEKKDRKKRRNRERAI